MSLETLIKEQFEMSDTQITNQTCQLISAKELAKMLSLSKRQIHRLNACGKIFAPIRTGGSVRFSAQECADWLQAGAPCRADWEAMKRAGGQHG